MKSFCCLLLCLSPAAFAANVGDTYAQVITEKGPPRSQVEVGSRRVLQYPDVAITLRDNLVTGLTAVTTPPAPKPAPAPVVAPEPTTREGKMAARKKEMDEAGAQVMRIVNQPVRAYVEARGMSISTYRTGWFHEGAMRPDFNTVDVRKTQEFPYDSHDYVTSNLNPGVVFVGRDLEFNSMTKFFYADRSVPKKKLTESEMVEINRLYRIIGRCEQQLAELAR